MGGAPLMARSDADLTTLRAGAATGSTSFTGVASRERPKPFRSEEAPSVPPAAGGPAIIPLSFIEIILSEERCRDHRDKHKSGQPPRCARL